MLLPTSQELELLKDTDLIMWTEDEYESVPLLPRESVEKIHRKLNPGKRSMANCAYTAITLASEIPFDFFEIAPNNNPHSISYGKPKSYPRADKFHDIVLIAKENITSIEGLGRLGLEHVSEVSSFITKHSDRLLTPPIK